MMMMMMMMIDLSFKFLFIIISNFIIISLSHKLTTFATSIHHVAQRAWRRMNSMTAWASSVLSTTMAFSIPQAVETATSWATGKGRLKNRTRGASPDVSW